MLSGITRTALLGNILHKVFEHRIYFYHLRSARLLMITILIATCGPSLYPVVVTTTLKPEYITSISYVKTTDPFVPLFPLAAGSVIVEADSLMLTIAYRMFDFTGRTIGNGPVDMVIQTYRSGYPFRSHYAERIFIGRSRIGKWETANIQSNGFVKSGTGNIHVSWFYPKNYPITTRGIILLINPLYLLLNVVCLFIPLWLAVRLPKHCIAAYRIRHGLCPKCGYPANNAIICPECGGKNE